jgi:hypothetical protein
MRRTAIYLACAAAMALPARADVITYTATGIIAPSSGTALSGETWGIDGGGYFGPRGASIVGYSYAVTWIANDCECIGYPSPIVDVTLTINGRSYDFGGGGFYGEFYLHNPRNLNIQQTDFPDGGSFISTSIGWAITPGIQGEFQIINNQLYTTDLTSGVFEASPVASGAPSLLSAPAAPVPGPIIGAGLPGLLLFAFGLLFTSRRRSKQTRST